VVAFRAVIQRCGSGSAWIWVPRSGSTMEMRIRIKRGKNDYECEDFSRSTDILHEGLEMKKKYFLL
jgi:hypothetical protein